MQVLYLRISDELYEAVSARKSELKLRSMNAYVTALLEADVQAAMPAKP